jgi:hypothetical protein
MDRDRFALSCRLRTPEEPPSHPPEKQSQRRPENATRASADPSAFQNDIRKWIVHGDCQRATTPLTITHPKPWPDHPSPAAPPRAVYAGKARSGYTKQWRARSAKR